MLRRVCRVLLVAWCASWCAWWPVVASAVTIPTRMVNGMYVYAPSAGTIAVNAIGSTLSRLNPWIGALSLGIEIARYVVQTPDGQVAISTAGKAVADAYEKQFGGTSTYAAPVDHWTVLPGEPCSGSPSHAITGGTLAETAANQIAWTNSAWANCSGFTPQTLCSVDLPNSRYFYTNTQYPVCPGTIRGATPTCTDGASYAGNNMCSAVPHTTDARVKVSDAWSPRQIVNPDGSVSTGWQTPSDPDIPQAVSPGDTLQGQPINGANPQYQFTPNPDGGMTAQTWYPEFNDQAHPTTQTGWTVQNVTINNAGNVTNISITTNVQGAAPTPPHPPTVPATTPAPVDANGNPVNPSSSSAQNLQCGSLNCESTQQGIHSDTSAIKDNTAGILTELQANGAPTLPDQASALAAAKASDLEQSQTISNAITLDQSHWFAWAWTPPAGTCTAPEAHLAGGVTVSFNYCPFVDNIKLALGWLFAIFASWHVYGVLFRRDEA